MTEITKLGSEQIEEMSNGKSLEEKTTNMNGVLIEDIQFGSISVSWRPQRIWRNKLKSKHTIKFSPLLILT